MKPPWTCGSRAGGRGSHESPWSPAGIWSGTAAPCLAGPLCTPGDLLAREIDLPELGEGDVVAIPHTGAYGPTAGLLMFLGGRPRTVVVTLMASDAHTWNLVFLRLLVEECRALRPAMVVVSERGAELMAAVFDAVFDDGADPAALREGLAATRAADALTVGTITLDAHTRVGHLQAVERALRDGQRWRAGPSG